LANPPYCFDRVQADRFAELLAADVPLFFRFVGDHGVLDRPRRTAHSELLVGVTQCVEDKHVCVEMKSLVAPKQFGQGMGWINHIYIVGAGGGLGNRQRWWVSPGVYS